MTKVAIIVCDNDPNQSTFIVALREKLQCDKDFLYSGEIPAYSYYNGYYLTPTIIDKLRLKIKPFNLKKELFERYLRRQQIKTVIAEYGITATSVIDSCRKLGLQLITHFHGFDAYEHSVLKNYHKKYTDVFNYSSHIIVVSHHMAQQLIKLGAPKEKIIYNPCSPNERFFELILDSNSNTFISTGRFVDKKAPYFTILAFNEVIKQHPEMKLIMIGDGPLLNSCINLAAYLGIEKSVVFSKKRNLEEILKLTSSAFCYVQHSITASNGDSEGTPVAVMEAAAAGLPVISTKHTGIQEVHQHEVTALLSDEKDVQAMVRNMLRLTRNRELAKRLGDNGKKQMKQKHTIEQYISTIENCIIKH